MPYVSVIIPAFNAADFIIDAYRSVIDQTIDDWEIIFVNDGSQDNTLGTIESFAVADKRVKVIDVSSNSGPAHARNAALAIAEGDWVAVLDADDKYSPDRLEVLTHAGERTRSDIVLDNQFVIDPISRRIAFLAFEPPKNEVTNLEFVDFLRNTQSSSLFDFGYLQPIIRRHWLAVNNIRYQEQLRLGEDLMLLFECYANGAKVILVSKPYYHYTFQYSLIHRTWSPTTRTDVSCEPLLVAAEQFTAKHRAKQSRLERCLVASTCESLREMVIATAFRDYLKRFDIVGLVGCLRHPVRLLRGIYFNGRRTVLLRRRIRTTILTPDTRLSGQVP
jgi:succinoglycan biosynthesis protein ExoO